MKAIAFIASVKYQAYNPTSMLDIGLGAGLERNSETTEQCPGASYILAGETTLVLWQIPVKISNSIPFLVGQNFRNDLKNLSTKMYRTCDIKHFLILAKNSGIFFYLEWCPGSMMLLLRCPQISLPSCR